MEKSNDINQYSELLYNFAITIGIILLVFFVFYAIYFTFYSQSNVQNNLTHNSANSASIYDNRQSGKSKITNKNESELESKSESEYHENISTQPTVHECIQSSQIVELTTKQIYDKLEEITLPSSISSSTGGYVGRDFVCFRSKMGDESYVSKNTGCIACQVDKSGKNNNYGNTKTNVISTCVYTDDPTNKDPSIWTKHQCVASCEKLQDVN